MRARARAADGAFPPGWSAHKGFRRLFAVALLIGLAGSVAAAPPGASSTAPLVPSGNGSCERTLDEATGVKFQPAPSPAGQDDPGLPYAHELLSFLGLASTIWLGVYLVGQPKRTALTWLTALTLWSLAGIFLDDFMGFNQPAVGFLRQIRDLFGFWPSANEIISRILLLGWVSKFAVVLWFHATTLMRPGKKSRGRHALVLIGYGLASVAALIQLVSPAWLAADGPAYSIFAASLLLFVALSMANLVEGIRRARSEIERRQFVLLLAASILACLSGVVYLVGVWSGAPSLVARTSLLWLAVLPLGYGVANYSAIVEGRTIRRHFISSLIAVSLVTLLYFVVSYLSSVSFGVRTAAFAFVVLLAVVTHSLAGNARAVLDYFFVDPETRRVLRAIRMTPNNLAGAGRLDERLALALDALCTELRASYGLVLLLSEGTVRLAAGYHWSHGKDLSISPEALVADDISLLEPEKFAWPLEGVALLAPLYLDTEHVGGVLLGHPVNATRYAAADAELAGYATDHMAEMIRIKRLEAEAVDRIVFVQQPANPVGEPSLEAVETGLRRMNDFVYLGTCPLSTLGAVTARLPVRATHVDRGKATHHVLAEAIERLRPAGQKPTLTSPREWHHYMILHEAYVMDRPNRDVMAELYISEGTFNRRRREAIEAVRRMLREGEEGEKEPIPG